MGIYIGKQREVECGARPGTGWRAGSAAGRRATDLGCGSDQDVLAIARVGRPVSGGDKGGVTGGGDGAEFKWHQGWVSRELGLGVES